MLMNKNTRVLAGTRARIRSASATWFSVDRGSVTLSSGLQWLS
jgi:hypothetical protein